MKKKIIRGFIVALSLATVATAVSSVAILQSKANDYIPELVEPVSLEEVYGVGESVIIPSASIQYGNEKKEANIIVHSPDNKSYAKNEIFLDISGAYTIEYQAKFDDKIQSVYQTFYAFTDAYSLSSSKNSVYFGENKKDTTAYGLNMELSRNEVLRYAYPIDLNDFDKETPVVSIRVLPEMDGVYDFTELYIRFIDAYDASNYVTTKIHNNFKAYSNQSWQLVAAANQPFKGRDWQRHDQRIFNGDYGTVVGCTLNGAKDPAYGANNCEVYWDYQERQVFGALDLRKPGANNMVADLDDLVYYDTLWEGFTTGEVFVEIWTDQNTSVGNLCIQTIGDWDLSKKYLDERIVYPSVKVDCDEASVPVGAVGMKYKLFDATANDLFTDSVTITKKVFRNYGTSSQVELASHNGYFVPMQAGIYTIEYVATNRAMGKSVETVEISIANTAKPLALSDIKPTETTGLVGLPVKIANALIAEEGNGEAKITVSVQDRTTSETYTITEKDGVRSFIPVKAGTYEVKYVLTDYIGQTDSFSYEVQVTLNAGAVVDTNPILPKYFIQGEKYILPLHYAKKYNQDGSYQEIACEITITDGNGNTVLGTDRVYTPKTNTSIQEATVVYSAGENSSTYNEKIEIVNVKNAEGKLDVSAYFKTSAEMSVGSEKNNLTFTANSNGANAKFINKLLVEPFSFRFAPDINGDVGRVDILLTDVYDSDQRIKFSFFRYAEADKCEFSVNDGRRYVLSIPFSSKDTTDTIYVEYSSFSSTVTVNNDKFRLFIDKNPLKDAKEVYFEFVASELTKPSDIRVDRLCGQILSASITVDRYAPMIALDNEMEKSVAVGTEIELSTARALDVLSPTTTLLVTVYDPDQNVVADMITGKEIKKSAPDVIYKIKCDKLGEYSIQYTATDSGTKPASWSYTIRAIENTSPEITLKEPLPTTAKVGDFVKMSEVQFIDDVDGSVNSYICITLPSGAMLPFDMEKHDGFQVVDVGTYVVTYMAWDSTGNYTLVSYKIIVN